MSLLGNHLLGNNLKLAFRLLGRNPVSSLVLALTLGLGIGLSSVVFSLADAILFRPLPFPEPERLVAVYEASKGRDDIRVADGNFFDVRQQATALSGLAGYACNRDLVTAGANTHQVPVCAVTADFFPVLGVSPALGRATLLQGEKTSGGAVVSHHFWQTALGGDPAALGRTLRVFGLAVPVTGVLPAGFAFPAETEVWVGLEPFLGQSRTAHNMLLLGRLRPGESLASARSQMSTIAGRLVQSYSHEIGKDFGLAVKDLHADLVGDTGKTVLLLWVIVSTVLFIACGNIAGILLARTLGRLTEISIRQSLGASRLQLGLQLLTESAVLGVLGSLAGLALAGVLLPVASSLVPASFLHSGPLVLDLRVVAFSILMGLLAGVLCAVLPIFQVTRRMPLESLHTGVLPAVGGGRPRRLAGVFVVAQYALSLAAVVAAGLLVESLIRLTRVDPGFATGGRVAAEIIVPTQPPSRYADEDVLARYYENVLQEVASLPGVRRATLSQSLPFVGQQYNGMALREGEPIPSEEDAQFYPDYRAVGSGYFATMAIPLVLGRDFLPSDDGSAEPVVIVNQALARQMWGNGNPLGQRLKLPGLDFDEIQADRLLRVVGVVPDVRQGGLDQNPAPAAYVPWRQHMTRAGALSVIAEVTTSPAAMVEPVRQRIQAQDPGVPLGRVRTIDELISASTSEQRFRAGVLSAFAALALVLAVLGVYGVMHYSLSKRRREMAIRMAVGARPRDIRVLALREGLSLVLTGEVLGLVLFVFLARLLRDLLFGVEAGNLPILAASSLSLALAVFGTCYLASRQASRVEPNAVLKAQ